VNCKMVLFIGWLAGCTDGVNTVPQEQVAQLNAAEGSGWIEPASGGREMQSDRSSRRRCYCFPKGDYCHADAWVGGSREAPKDAEVCPDGEVCYANSATYAAGFGGPRGRCIRLCYHSGSQPPGEGFTEELRGYARLNCATGEVCRLQEVDKGFEGLARGTVGLCVTPPPSDQDTIVGDQQ